jgi:hypothetical protein
MRVMSVIRAAAIAAAMPIHPASATDVLCDGDFQNHGHAGASVENPQISCFIPSNSQAALQVFDFCVNGEQYSHCTFVGHVSRRNGREYVIDRIGSRDKLKRWFNL